jgi:uncharacterized protein YktB (UPF0637 family)
MKKGTLWNLGLSYNFLFIFFASIYKKPESSRYRRNHRNFSNQKRDEWLEGKAKQTE